MKPGMNNMDVNLKHLTKSPLLIQGIYYLITGIWPILHITSFVQVSGPKIDLWLVKTVGVLIGIIGGALLIHYFNKKASLTMEIIFLSIASAVSMGFIDVYYAAINRIWDVYLFDAAAQAIVLLMWLVQFVRYNVKG